MVISSGLSTNVVPPFRNKKSLSRNPHNTLMHGIPQLRAVAMSTSLSPTYTAVALSAFNRFRASFTGSGAGFLRIASLSPIATSIYSLKNVWHRASVAFQYLFLTTARRFPRSLSVLSISMIPGYGFVESRLCFR